MKTTIPKVDEVQHAWFVVDATDQPAGRIAAEIARILRGKNKRNFTPHMDMGDFVVVVNAEKVRLTGNKEEQKIYTHYTGWPSGLREFKAKHVRERNPTRIVTQAVKGMLPKNRLSRKLIKRLKVYAGPDHPHQAQQPQTVSFA